MDKIQKVYPKEMVNIENGAIVLFDSYGVGRVIDPAMSSYSSGDYSPNWNMEYFIELGE